MSDLRILLLHLHVCCCCALSPEPILHFSELLILRDEIMELLPAYPVCERIWQYRLILRDVLSRILHWFPRTQRWLRFGL